MQTLLDLAKEAKDSEFSVSFEKYNRLIKSWIGYLQEDRIVAAHPDDGWVNRNNNRIHLGNPYFNNGISIGDKIAIGDPDQYQIVRIIGFNKWILEYYDYEVLQIGFLKFRVEE